MADAQMGPVNQRFIDKRRGRTQDGVALTEAANYGKVADLKTRLAAISATKYSAARLANMTVNDMVYALRVETADAGGIK